MKHVHVLAIKGINVHQNYKQLALCFQYLCHKNYCNDYQIMHIICHMYNYFHILSVYISMTFKFSHKVIQWQTVFTNLSNVLENVIDSSILKTLFTQICPLAHASPPYHAHHCTPACQTTSFPLCRCITKQYNIIHCHVRCIGLDKHNIYIKRMQFVNECTGVQNPHRYWCMTQGVMANQEQINRAGVF